MFLVVEMKPHRAFSARLWENNTRNAEAFQQQG